MNDEPALAEQQVDWSDPNWQKRLKRSGMILFIRQLNVLLGVLLLIWCIAIFLLLVRGFDWFLFGFTVFVPVFLSWRMSRYLSGLVAVARLTGMTTYRLRVAGLSFQNALGQGLIAWPLIEGFQPAGDLWVVRYARTTGLSISIPDGPFATEVRTYWQEQRRGGR